jgi:hypothetical protein
MFVPDWVHGEGGEMLRGRANRRLGLLVAAVLTALALPSLGAADTFIGGTATGRTLALGNGTFQVVGTYRDAAGEVGTYHGTYTEVTTGYTSCRSTGIGEIFCGTAAFPYSCNLIAGEITLRSRGRYVTLHIGPASLGPPGSRVQSGVCLREGSAQRDTFLMVTNRTNVWPATVEEFSRGYGILAWAQGALVGTSSPLGGGRVYAEELALDLGLFGNPPG